MVAFDQADGAALGTGVHLPAGTQNAEQQSASPTGARDIHRIGGGHVDNLMLKPAEVALIPPGISVLKRATAKAASRQMREAFPRAAGLHALARTVGSTTAELIRNAGFDLLADPTRRFPNHFRLIHPDGIAGFSRGNLAQLSTAFVDTMIED
jgi:hypothetical protein